MLLHLQWATSVPPNGILDFPAIRTRLSGGLRDVNLVGSYGACVTATMADLCDVQTSFLCNLKFGSARWVFPSHHAPAGQ